MGITHLVEVMEPNGKLVMTGAASACWGDEPGDPGHGTEHLATLLREDPAKTLT
jgi:hypothetical protein